MLYNQQTSKVLKDLKDFMIFLILTKRNKYNNNLKKDGNKTPYCKV